MSLHKHLRLKKVILALGAALLMVSCLNGGKSWREASRESAGIAPDPAKHQEAVLQIYGARAWSWRGWFAIHTWIAAKPEKAPQYTVYDVVGWRKKRGRPVLRIAADLPDRYWFDARPEILLQYRGAKAAVLIDKLERIAPLYPWPDEYRVFPGPNSNTFTAWVARKIPEMELRLPWRALGSGYAAKAPETEHQPAANNFTGTEPANQEPDNGEAMKQESANPEQAAADLVARLAVYNQAYRRGEPLISDNEYDNLIEELRRLDPEHPFLHQVEPEVFSGRREVKHPQAMLSTEKAYSPADLQRFIERVEKTAADHQLESPVFRVTPKLDGLAARDDGEIFASRGNGESGYEISSAFIKGVVAVGGRGLGLGEIVIKNSYFEEFLAAHFEHPRNLVVGIINADTLNPYAEKALAAGAVCFVPYSQLPAWRGQGGELVANWDKIKAELTEQTDYPLDGMIVENEDEQLKELMGFTNHHYRWQIAVKTKGETARTVIEEIGWQVGRSGVVTPVLHVRPVAISGATIRRVSAHNAGLVKEKQLGAGAEIEIIRSGEVIPKLEKVLRPAAKIELPQNCPSCGSDLSWQNDFLKCDNPACPAQIEGRLRHWFKTLGTADWFGPKTIARLVVAGHHDLPAIYKLQAADFEALEFGPQQSLNLEQALATSRRRELADWRFLAALGLPSLGLGDSRRLLAVFSLDELLAGISQEEIIALDGFAETTAAAIIEGFSQREPEIRKLLAIEFNLLGSKEQAAALPESPITGKALVFTGKMTGGSREEMEAEARSLGAQVQKAVSGKTDLLVCGEKVGESKTGKAQKLGVKIISEAEYLELIKN